MVWRGRSPVAVTGASGGGIIGCSIAYHLAKLGITDVVLLERRQLTCGTTWHAAGLVGQLRASQNMTRLAKYSADLYTKLEAETGLATGFRQCGSITTALTDSRIPRNSPIWRRARSTTEASRSCSCSLWLRAERCFHCRTVAVKSATSAGR